MLDCAPYLVFFLALAVRLAYLWSVRGTPVIEAPVLDAAFYHDWALRISQGEWTTGGVFFMTPIYPYMLAVLYALFGPSLWAPLILQAFAGAALCALIESAARRLFSPGPALLAGLWAAFYGPFVFHDGVLMKESWIALANMAALLMLLGQEGSSGPRLRVMLGAGVLIGISVLFRPNIFLWVPLLAWWSWRRYGRRAAVAFLVLIAGIAIAVFPLTLRNRLVGGEWVITVASGGMNLWTGNNPEATGTYYGAPFVSSQVPEKEQEEFRLEASRRAGRELTLAESSRHWRDEALRFALRSPGKAIRIWWRKWAYFWHSWEIPSNLNYYVAKDSSPVLKALVFGFGWLGPLSILGLLLCRRGLPDRLWLPFSLLAVQLATNLVFFTHAAYRIAAVPMLFLFAAGALREVRAAYENRRSGALAAALAILAAGAYFCNRPVARIEGMSKEMGYFTCGLEYQKQGRYAKAEAMYRRALRTNPDSTMILKKMTELYQKMGREESARESLARALRSKTAAGAAAESQERATQLFLEKRYEEAAAAFGRLIESDPDNAHSNHNNRGLAYLRMRDVAAAEADFRKAAQLKPDYAPARYNLGLVLLKRGRTAEAVREFEETLRIEPNHVRARQKLDELR
ncbi:MAG: tetratricopeptide repeat protein [Elusimicrobiota bacterium]